MKIISCNANPILAKKIVTKLNSNLVSTEVKRFSDKEIFVSVNENVRGKETFIIQSISYPVNDNLMELLITIDTLKRASVNNITAVIPYFGYARQDRKTAPRTPITAKLVANLLVTAGINRVLTLDLHAGQIQGFFDIPVDNLYASPVFTKHIIANNNLNNLIIVSPDVGGVKRARLIAEKLEVDLAIVDKRREQAGVSEVMNIIGNIKNKNCIIIDDIIDSAGTLCNAAQEILNQGAKSVSAYVSHGVLSGSALSRIQDSVLDNLFITDSIENVENKNKIEKIKIISIAPLMAEAINRIANGGSISDLFL